MGIIKKQAIRSSVYNYLGVLIGFLNASILSPIFLTTTQIGLLSIFNSLSGIFAQVFSLGINNLFIKCYSSYTQKERNSFHFFALLVFLSGGFLSWVFTIVFDDFITSIATSKSDIYLRYSYLLIVIILFRILYRYFDAFLRLNFNSVLGSSVESVGYRIIMLLAIGLLAYGLITFDSFVYLFVFAMIFPGITLMTFAMIKFKVQFKMDRAFLNKVRLREFGQIMLFGVVSGAGTMIVFELDRIMLSYYKGLDVTGVYATLFYFGWMVTLPSRGLKRIGGAVISSLWAKNDIPAIDKVYKQSSVNQMIVGIYFLVGIMICQSSVLELLPDEYRSGTQVMFIIALGGFFDLITGVNIDILGASSIYKYNTYTTLFMIVLVVVFNVLLIPDFGLHGAALSSLLAILVINIIRLVLLKKHYGLWPFNKQTIRLTLVLLILTILQYFIPDFKNAYLNILIKGSVFTALFWPIVYRLNFSEELNDLIKSALKRFSR